MNKFWSQNLNENRAGDVTGSMFWSGRCKWRSKRELSIEWHFGPKARGFSATMSFGEGGDSSVMLHLCLPWVFSIFVTLDGIWRTKAFKTGVAIHNKAIWFYPLSWCDEWKSKDPWWRKYHAWYFPWDYDWLSTEILEHKANLPGLAKTVYMDRRRGLNRGGLDGFRERHEREDAAKKLVQETYDYTYRLKNGTIQNRQATVHVTRMTLRMRWWPLLPFKKVSTSIDVLFNDEVGERTGSWKGGCIGCGYGMLVGETPLETLRRMEKERTF